MFKATKKNNKHLKKSTWLNKTEYKELLRLISDMEAMGFSSSTDLSKYIRKNNLGCKYPHISGIIKMRNEGDTWDFNGGFPPKIFSILCRRLSFNKHGKGTSARVVGFTPYKDILE